MTISIFVCVFVHAAACGLVLTVSYQVVISVIITRFWYVIVIMLCLQVFSNISGLVVLDVAGNITDYNYNFTHFLFGYGRKELEGQVRKRHISPSVIVVLVQVGVVLLVMFLILSSFTFLLPLMFVYLNQLFFSGPIFSLPSLLLH